METRICSRCKQEKELKTEFYTHKAGRGGYRAECKVCSRSFKSQTSEKIMERVRKMRDRNRQFLWNYYAEHPCVDCGESDPVVLELDHVRGEKIGNVSQLVHNNRSLEVIQVEIDKCDVVCSNCHRRRTAKTQGWHSGIEIDILDFSDEKTQEDFLQAVNG